LACVANCPRVVRAALHAGNKQLGLPLKISGLLRSTFGAALYPTHASLDV
jgi:hypothetical protein